MTKRSNRAPLPTVILHNEVSLDGRMDWVEPDLSRFYSLAGRWHEDATLVGSETLLSGMPELAETARSPGAAPTAESGALLAVVDGRGRLPGVGLARRQPYWRDVVELCCESTPAAHLEELVRTGVDHVVSGAEHVDLRDALEWLAAEHRVRKIRVDAGGRLNGALLRAGLVDEVTVLVEPRLVGGASVDRSLFVAEDLDSADDVVFLELADVDRFDDGVVALSYVVRPSA